MKIWGKECGDYLLIKENTVYIGALSNNYFFSGILENNSLSDPIGMLHCKKILCYPAETDFESIPEEIIRGVQSDTLLLIQSENTNDVLGIIDHDTVTEWFCRLMQGKIEVMLQEEAKYLTPSDQLDIERPSEIDYFKTIANLKRLEIFNKDLNVCFENAPNALDVCDSDGNTLRVNKNFEDIVGVKREAVLGRNVRDLEAESIYKPSVASLVLKEKRKISVVQKIINNKDVIVTGVPIYDENGNLFRVMTDAIDLNELSALHSYMENRNNFSILESHDPQQIVCESKSMKEIFMVLDKIKDVDSTILLTGESGVGKGVIAHYIHNKSKRSKETMIELNCGAIPEALLESELLGYEAGAFTGASKSGKPGLIELAHNGTLFLDEIGEMSLSMQVKLLQVIQEKKITRVGGVRPIEIDVRIIAASNRNLKEMVDSKEFRLDLFYRLNVINIHIPPLRERVEDIRSGVTYFLEKYNRKYHKNVAIDDNVVKQLERNDWEGNMRQLENYIERSVVMNASNIFDIDNTEEKSLSSYSYPVSNSSGPLDANASLDQILQSVEKEIFNKAYQKYKSSYRVAQDLQISQTTAFRKLKRYVADF